MYVTLQVKEALAVYKYALERCGLYWRRNSTERRRAKATNFVTLDKATLVPYSSAVQIYNRLGGKVRIVQVTLKPRLPGFKPV